MRRALRLVGILLGLVALLVCIATGKAWLDYRRDPPSAAQAGPVGLWLEHRWGGETQTPAACDELAAELQRHGVTDVFVHVGPLDGSGAIPPQHYPNAATLVAALHARLPALHVQAWMGQMEKRRGGPLDLADPNTRAGIL